MDPFRLTPVEYDPFNVQQIPTIPQSGGLPEVSPVAKGIGDVGASMVVEPVKTVGKRIFQLDDALWGRKPLPEGEEISIGADLALAVAGGAALKSPVSGAVGTGVRTATKAKKAVPFPQVEVMPELAERYPAPGPPTLMEKMPPKKPGGMAEGKPVVPQPEDWTQRPNPKEAAPLALALTGRESKGIRAYHGSPHDFDRFSVEKIGTGEGAQAYGHGLYFAENPAVAKEYRDAIGGGEVLVGGKPMVYGEDLPWNLASMLKNIYKGDIDKMIADYPKLAPDLEAAKARGVEWKPAGKTYEVVIDATPDEFLDWDAPLSAQPKAVQEKFAPLLQRSIDEEMTSLTDPMKATGEDIYSALRDQAVGWKAGSGVPLEQEMANASSALRDAGLKGIRYKDAGSRDPTKMKELADDLEQYREAAKEWEATGNKAKLKIAKKQIEVLEARLKQTHNYVVFDDSTVSVIRKYGIAGLIAAGAGAGITLSPGSAEAAPSEPETPTNALLRPPPDNSLTDEVMQEHYARGSGA